MLPFKLVDEASDFGILTIGAARHLLILDYQHRWRGLMYAIEQLDAKSLETFTMPVVIVPNIPRFEEIRQFYLINSKQRRIDTDLALALLQTLAGEVEEKELENLVGPGKRFRIRGTRLTFALAGRADGPWAGRIAQPHYGPQPNAVIKLKSFVDSLAPIVSARAVCSQLDDDELLDVLSAFWTALQEIVPKAFDSPPAFQIQRTVGVYAFHLVFARKVYAACRESGRVSPRVFRRALEPAASDFINDTFWATKRPGAEVGASLYVGSSGYRELARLIMEKL